MQQTIVQNESRVWHRKWISQTTEGGLLSYLGVPHDDDDMCHWHNKFTGEPTCQKTITLEKASNLFNIAALYTQIGAKQDRTQLEELDKAVDCFLKAAGIFQHIIGEFLGGKWGVAS